MSAQTAPRPPAVADANEATVVYVGGIFTPLVPAILNWAVKQNASPFVNSHVTETLNWGITMLLVNIALSVVAVIVGKIVPPWRWFSAWCRWRFSPGTFT